MEDLNQSYKIELEIENFKATYFKFLSPYFNNVFTDCISRIEVEKNDKNKGKITFSVELDQKCANPFNKAHGGALVSIIENLSTLSLIYFDHPNYKTLDFNVNYKNQVEINQKLTLEIICEKLGFTTCFIEAEIKTGGRVCTQASIIKSKMIAKY